MTRLTKIRLFCGIAAVLLLLAEIAIGLWAHGWVRGSLGDVLVVLLLWAVCRAVTPEKPRAGWLLPVCILLFAYGVELLQLWGFCDRLHITSRLLRTLIGTGFSAGDLLCYTAGALLCLPGEWLIRRSASQSRPTQAPAARP